jgi:hypothetical protein
VPVIVLTRYVVRTEKGQRPLKLQEALHLAIVLDISSDLLMDETPLLDPTAVVLSATERAMQAWARLQEAAYDFEAEMQSLRGTIRLHETSNVPAPVMAKARDMLQLDTVDIVVAQRKRHGFDRLADDALSEAAIFSGLGEDAEIVVRSLDDERESSDG